MRLPRPLPGAANFRYGSLDFVRIGTGTLRESLATCALASRHIKRTFTPLVEIRRSDLWLWARSKLDSVSRLAFTAPIHGMLHIATTCSASFALGGTAPRPLSVFPSRAASRLPGLLRRGGRRFRGHGRDLGKLILERVPPGRRIQCIVGQLRSRCRRCLLLARSAGDWFRGRRGHGLGHGRQRRPRL